MNIYRDIWKYNVDFSHLIFIASKYMVKQTRCDRLFRLAFFLYCIILAREIFADYEVVPNSECSGNPSYSQTDPTAPDQCETHCNGDSTCKGSTVTI